MQSFDYEQVSTKMEQLKIVFTDFSKRLDTMDKKYTEGIAVDANSALYGSKADKVISHWNHLARSFSYFEKEFTELYDLVKAVASKNRSFEEEVAGIVNSPSDGTSSGSSSGGGGGGAIGRVGGGGAVRVNMIK